MRAPWLGFWRCEPKATPFLTASQSYAAPGDPFDPADPTVLLSQDSPTRLYKAVAGASGNVTFQPEGGTTTGLNYNALGYNTADNYLYAVVTASSTAMPGGAIVRIGQNGMPKRVGTNVLPNQMNWGRSPRTAASTSATARTTRPIGSIPPPARSPKR